MENDNGFWPGLTNSLGGAGMLAGGAAVAKHVAPWLLRTGMLGARIASPLAKADLAYEALRIPSANAGEVPYYVRDPNTGKMVPNPAATASSKQLLKQEAGKIGASPTPGPASPLTQQATLSPMPGSSPFPLQPNGMNPTGAPPMSLGAGSFQSPQAMALSAAIKHAQAGGQLPVSPANGASPLDHSQWPYGPAGAPPAPAPASGASPLNLAASGGPGTMPQYGVDGATSYSPQTTPLQGIQGILSKLFGGASQGSSGGTGGNLGGLY